MKKIKMIISFLFLFLMISYLPVSAEKSVVIAIDPGHGGENLGAEYGGYTEKEMTMVVARAMKEEFEKYEGVTVYLTHESTEDDMSLKERAEFAKEKHADFLFCLHFNMSLNNNLFGAEVWVSAFDKYYAEGYGFAQIEMEMLADLGLYSRGIKTRLNDSGDDYYGILRESRKINLNTVLIEHCHLDEERDKPFYTKGDSQLKEFGRLDATAAAKYFQLRSEELGVDYSDYPHPNIAPPTQVVKPDLSPPDVCLLEMNSLDQITGEAVFTLTAQDYDGVVLYYTYSLDGGTHYEPLEVFPKDEAEVTFSVVLPKDQNIILCGAAYNGYDRLTESEPLEIAAIPSADEENEAGVTENETVYEDISLENIARELEASQQEARQEGQMYQIIMVVVVCLMVLVMMILVSRIILLRRTNKRRETINQDKK